jgi:hypothetical protein
MGATATAAPRPGVCRDGNGLGDGARDFGETQGAGSVESKASDFLFRAEYAESSDAQQYAARGAGLASWD